MGTVHIKRIYDPVEESDGYRILIDRIWPRGVSKEHAALGVWMKEVAPSTELRKWWDHDPERLDEFSRRYRAELDENPAMDDLRIAIGEHATVTLLYSAHDPKINQAVVLQDYLAAK